MYIHCPISKSNFERPFKIRYHNLTNVSRKDYNCNIDSPTEDARICSKRAATRDHHHQVPMQSWVYMYSLKKVILKAKMLTLYF